MFNAFLHSICSQTHLNLVDDIYERHKVWSQEENLYDKFFYRNILTEGCIHHGVNNFNASTVNAD